MPRIVSLVAALVLIPFAARADSPPGGLWRSGDNAVLVRTGPCEAGSNQLCGIIAGIVDPRLTPYADDLCGLPLIWDLRPAKEAGRWVGGQLLDPETETIYPLQATYSGNVLTLLVGNLEQIIWTRSTAIPKGCP